MKTRTLLSSAGLANDSLRVRSCLLTTSVKFQWATTTLSHYKVSLFAFTLQRQNQIVATEIVQSAKPKMFTVWPVPEKVCQSLL